MVKIWSLLRDKQISLKDLLFIPHMIFKYKGFRGPSAAGFTLKSGTLKYRKTFCPETPALIQLHPRGNIVTFNIIPNVYTHTHTHTYHILCLSLPGIQALSKYLQTVDYGCCIITWNEDRIMLQDIL